MCVKLPLENLNPTLTPYPTSTYTFDLELPSRQECAMVKKYSFTSSFFPSKLPHDFENLPQTNFLSIYIYANALIPTDMNNEIINAQIKSFSISFT